MTLLDCVSICQLAATSYLVGVIWLIQVVHYPMLEQLDPRCAGEACKGHATRITPVVGIPMLVEAAAAISLVLPGLFSMPRETRIAAWAGLVLVGAIWVSTFALQVPQHEKLAKQAGAIDFAAVRLLVSSNWIRTAMWSLRLPLAAYILVSMMHQSPV